MRTLDAFPLLARVLFVSAPLLVLASIATDVRAEECSTPLPDYQVTPADATVPVEFARFLGRWSNGRWDGKLCGQLVVESVDAYGNVVAIYSHGTYSGWRIDEPGSFRTPGKIVDGKLHLAKFRNGAKASYWLIGDTLKGDYRNAGGKHSYIELHRQPG